MNMANEAKTKFRISKVNAAEAGAAVSRDEALYGRRVAKAAEEIIASGRRVVLLSGPSGSGKTTSSLKLAARLVKDGRHALVISLDDFFKNIKDYPETEDGQKDYESVYAVDIALVNEKLRELVECKRAVLPLFDFIFQRRKAETREVSLGVDGIAIVEGIHALNPLISESIDRDRAYRIYAGLRGEYFDGERRVIPTRDMRIVRRMIRDYYFRGHSIEKTLELWDNLQKGETKWIRIFKSEADCLLDTSFSYEARVFRPLLEGIFADRPQGGKYRAVLEEIVNRFSGVSPIDSGLVPENSMIREFIGGLIL